MSTERAFCFSLRSFHLFLGGEGGFTYPGFIKQNMVRTRWEIPVGHKLYNTSGLNVSKTVAGGADSDWRKGRDRRQGHGARGRLWLRGAKRSRPWWQDASCHLLVPTSLMASSVTPQPLIVYPSSTELLAPATSYLAKRIFMQKVKKPIQVSVYTKCAKSSLPMWPEWPCFQRARPQTLNIHSMNTFTVVTLRQRPLNPHCVMT